MPVPADANEWLRFADEDLAAAHRLLDDADLAPRLSCFHAQQAAEKAVKALLTATGRAFPRTHDVVALSALLEGEVCEQIESVDLALLAPWAVDARYPGDIPEISVRDARLVVEVAEHTVLTAQRALGSGD